MAQVFTDRISNSAHVESVVLKKDVIKAGQFLKLGILDSDGESRISTKATKDEDADVFFAPAEIGYGDPHFDVTDIKLVAGKVGRAFHKGEGEIISVTKDLISGANVGDNVSVGEEGLGFKKATSGKGIGLVIGKEAHGLDGETFVIAFN